MPARLSIFGPNRDYATRAILYMILGSIRSRSCYQVSIL